MTHPVVPTGPPEHGDVLGAAVQATIADDCVWPVQEVGDDHPVREEARRGSFLLYPVGCLAGVLPARAAGSSSIAAPLIMRSARREASAMMVNAGLAAP